MAGHYQERRQQWATAGNLTPDSKRGIPTSPNQSPSWAHVTSCEAQQDRKLSFLEDIRCWHLGTKAWLGPYHSPWAETPPNPGCTDSRGARVREGDIIGREGLLGITVVL